MKIFDRVQKELVCLSPDKQQFMDSRSSGIEPYAVFAGAFQKYSGYRVCGSKVTHTSARSRTS